ncbi:MAG TPA: hypothetical protein PKA77_08440 [Chitinophagaceae bacterium]|jgi:hypothetical protein|nr:hypothetical protein [Chitinophagaceae bacterium]HMU57535.1 hypothetical protein [Chitinophagaceae bacterium]
MKNFLSFFAVALFFSGGLFSQMKSEPFDITIPDTVVKGSLYNRLTLVDKRTDTFSVGIIQKGAFNKRVRINTITPLQKQFSELLKYIIDSVSAKKGEMLLVLREFSFAEITGAFGEKGYFHLRGNLFEKDGQLYTEISGVDTVLVVTGLDVTKKMLAKGSRFFTDFIVSSLKEEPKGCGQFSFSQVDAIDSIEKSKLPLYTVTDFKNGAYRDFNSFVNQVPDDTTLIINYSKNGVLKSIEAKKKNGKYTDVELNKWYAFAYNNRLFISADYGVYPLEKKGDDFFFTGRASVPANSGDVIAASVFFGLIGVLAASGGSSADFYMKIDHRGGGFIRIRKVTGK